MALNKYHVSKAAKLTKSKLKLYGEKNSILLKYLSENIIRNYSHVPRARKQPDRYKSTRTLNFWQFFAHSAMLKIYIYPPPPGGEKWSWLRSF